MYKSDVGCPSTLGELLQLQHLSIPHNSGTRTFLKTRVWQVPRQIRRSKLARILWLPLVGLPHRVDFDGRGMTCGPTEQ